MKLEGFVYGALIFLLLFASGYFFLSNEGGYSKDKGTNIVAANSGDVQKVTLSMKNYNYYPNTIKVREGVPVEITLDERVVGCLRAFTIKDLGINIYSKTPNDKITFTPDKKGTFRFSCTMGMGTGTFIVE